MQTDNNHGTFEAFNPGLMLIVLTKVKIATSCNNSKGLLKMLYLKCTFLQPVFLLENAFFALLLLLFLRQFVFNDILKQSVSS